MTREERLEQTKRRMATDETNGTSQFVGAYSLPEGVEIYKIKEGRNLIDIVPYRVTNPNNPAIKQGFNIGDEDYLQVYHVHKGIGTNKNTYLCMNRMYGKKCAICDIQRGMWDTDKEGAKKLYPNQRVLYNVIDRLEPEKGVQILEGSYHWWEKELRQLASFRTLEGQPVIYGDREMGATIEFQGVKSTFEGREFVKPLYFNFIKRDAYDESILDKTYPIDTFFIEPKYKDVENDYYGVNEEEDVSEAVQIPPTPVATRATPIVTNVTEPPMDDFDKAVAESEKTILGMAEDDEPPFDVATTPPTRRERRKTEDCLVCPYGHTCGEDFSNFPDCDKCSDDIYDKCGKKYEEKYQ